MKFNKEKVNNLKSMFMTDLKWVESVHERGFEDITQFNSFKNLCGNLVDMCNGYLKPLKPSLKLLQRRRNLLYKDLYLTCSYVVERLNMMIDEYMEAYKEASDKAEALSQLETRCRMEHEIAIEYRNREFEKDKKTEKKSYAGFKTSSMTKKPKKRKTTKKKKDEQ